MSATTIPKRVLICGIGYKITIAEDAVIFSEEKGVHGCYARLMFQRVAGCWYVSIFSSSDRAMVSHIVEAMKIVRYHFGDNHEFVDGENKP